uniref:Cs-BCD1 protein n=1 Tax=Ciona savignyi TaxID=51511 RepID=Q95YJ9_CIOSA|nr:Cs-BCD1 [Ciona savignyi]
MKVVLLVYLLAQIMFLTPEAQGQCDPPLWNGKLGNNWNLPGILPNSKPKFNLTIKKLDKNYRYRPGKRHNIKVQMANFNSTERMLGFFLTLEPISDQPENCMCSFNVSCGLGRFNRPRRTKLGPKLPENCDQLIFADNRKSTKVSFSVVWIAPTCGGVTMRATIRSKKRKIYSDDDDIEPQYQLLTKVLYAGSG